VRNVRRIKWAMVKYARAHGIGYEDTHIKPSVPVWGGGARRLAHRITKGRTRACDQRLIDLVLPPSFGERVVRAARGEVGVTENPPGSNDGPRVKQYQAVTGMYRQPWCASFVAWCLRQAGYDGPLPSSPAWVPSWAAAARTGKPAAFSSVPRVKLRRGDFVCLWNNGHIEVFVRWVVPGVLAECIGGNTSPVGKQANGGMVARTRRYTYEMSACGRVKG
jgi:hypothetical protein